MLLFFLLPLPLPLTRCQLWTGLATTLGDHLRLVRSRKPWAGDDCDRPIHGSHATTCHAGPKPCYTQPGSGPVMAWLRLVHWTPTGQRSTPAPETGFSLVPLRLARTTIFIRKRLGPQDIFESLSVVKSRRFRTECWARGRPSWCFWTGVGRPKPEREQTG